MKNLQTLLSKLKKKCYQLEKEKLIEIVTNDEASNVKGGNKEYKPLYLLETHTIDSKSNNNCSDESDQRSIKN